jgi:hypothetical protein
LARNRRPTISDIERAKLRGEQLARSHESNERALLRLHPPLIDAYRKKLEQLLDELAAYIARPISSASGIHAQASAISQEICIILDALRNQSGGKLPTEYFEHLWQAHGCK